VGKWSWDCFNVLSLNLRRTEKNHETAGLGRDWKRFGVEHEAEIQTATSFACF